MTLHQWEDYEINIETRDKARDFWHGCLVFFALIAILSLVGCEHNTLDPNYRNLAEASKSAVEGVPAMELLPGPHGGPPQRLEAKKPGGPVRQDNDPGKKPN